MHTAFKIKCPALIDGMRDRLVEEEGMCGCACGIAGTASSQVMRNRRIMREQNGSQDPLALSADHQLSPLVGYQRSRYAGQYIAHPARRTIPLMGKGRPDKLLQ